MVTKTKVAATSNSVEQLESALEGCVTRATLDHEAGLIRDLLVQRYREFGLELFEERANGMVDMVRRIFARLSSPLEEGVEEDKPVIDMTRLGDTATEGVK